ncbi:DUF1140 family protein [Staphylococcus nepalensis]|uniref:DUF1140 family protein n=1 Tax=Staphylococcus nepalensis TaxID=214473 RepID=UPI0011CB312F|nr:DUF1140 family protein [Staphylococcus nepalensis]MCY1039610.1 DUF1140 family protein [Staphylococcus nepalensis]
MNSGQLLTMHSDVVIKKLLQLADKSYKSFLRASNTSYNAEIGTSRYWKAIGSMEQSQFEFNDYMKQLKFMDELTQWSDKLHQDRYKFVEKYDIVMEKYKLS